MKAEYKYLRVLHATGEILRLRSRTCLRFRFAKPPKSIRRSCYERSKRKTLSTAFQELRRNLNRREAFVRFMALKEFSSKWTELDIKSCVSVAVPRNTTAVCVTDTHVARRVETKQRSKSRPLCSTVSERNNTILPEQSKQEVRAAGTLLSSTPHVVDEGVDG